MRPITRRRWAAAAVLAASWLATTATEARAQVAFQPVVGAFPNGATLPVTPVVSHDRRYVRMTLAPTFNGLEGFDVFPVPGAVGGVNGGGGGGRGLGGIGGGGGAGGRGGGGLAAGMDGVYPAGSSPMLASGVSANPGFASPDATAVLAGASFPDGPPRLSAGMPESPRPRVAPKARAKRVKKAPPRTR